MMLLLVRSSQAPSTPALLGGLDPSRDAQDFSSSPVLSVWALCHGCGTWLWVKKYALPGVLVYVFCFLSVHRLPWWALSQHQIVSPPQAPYYVLSSQPLCDSLSCSMHSFFLFLWPSPPLPTTTGFHICSACPSCLCFFFPPAPHSTFPPCPRTVYFLCLACLSWTTYPVSNPSFSSGLQNY